MTDLTDRLDAIQRRLDAATPGAITITPSDVAFLRDLARKQQAEMALMQWKLDALAEWSSGMIDQSYYPQYGRDVKALLDVASLDEAKEIDDL